jgi:phage virion morphogenesis protein
MAVTLTLRLEGDTLSPAVAAMARRAGDLSPAMDAIASYMLSETQQRFEDQRAPDGAAWKPSKAATEEGRKTLIASARLLQSLVGASDATSAEVGTNVIYAAIHNEGGTIRPKTQDDGTPHVLTRALRTPFGPRASVTLPRRQFIGFGPEDPAEIGMRLVRHLEGAA